jgi:hypothetical protein
LTRKFIQKRFAPIQRKAFYFSLPDSSQQSGSFFIYFNREEWRVFFHFSQLAQGGFTMSATLLVAQGNQITRMPEAVWKGHLSEAPDHIRSRLTFMTEDHHRVRYFVVRELPRFGRPIPVKAIATALDLAVGRVDEILSELERNLFFLWRNNEGAVEWAYPVTAASTGHHLIYSTGERLDGA